MLSPLAPRPQVDPVDHPSASLQACSRFARLRAPGAGGRASRAELFRGRHCRRRPGWRTRTRRLKGSARSHTGTRLMSRRVLADVAHRFAPKQMADSRPGAQGGVASRQQARSVNTKRTIDGRFFDAVNPSLFQQAVPSCAPAALPCPALPPPRCGFCNAASVSTATAPPPPLAGRSRPPRRTQRC